MHSKEFEKALAEYYEAKKSHEEMERAIDESPLWYVEKTEKRLTAAKRRIIDAVAGWRSIETPPKDGKLVCLMDEENVIVNAVFQDDEWFFQVPIEWSMYFFGKPKYWMPLPPLPEEENG